MAIFFVAGKLFDHSISFYIWTDKIRVYFRPRYHKSCSYFLLVSASKESGISPFCKPLRLDAYSGDQIRISKRRPVKRFSMFLVMSPRMYSLHWKIARSWIILTWLLRRYNDKYKHDGIHLNKYCIEHANLSTSKWCASTWCQWRFECQGRLYPKGFYGQCWHPCTSSPTRFVAWARQV